MLCNFFLAYLLSLAALAAGAVVIHVKFASLSLPAPLTLRILAILLPILNGLSTLLPRPSSSGNRHAKFSRSQMAIYPVVQGIQAVLTIVLATLFGTFMAPTSDPVALCRLSSQWETFWRARDESTVKRLQNEFNCCGFRTTQDRAWPFSTKENPKTSQCKENFGREMACMQPWAQEFQRNAGAAVAVVVAVGILQIINVIYGREIRSGWSWIRAQGPFWRQRSLEESRRSLLPAGDEVDEDVQRDGDLEEGNGYGGTGAGYGPRVEPSALGDGERNEWGTAR